MKVRSGFVSNSSSSSFIVATKPGVTKEDFINLMKVPKDSPLYFMAVEVASLLFSKQTTSVTDAIKEYEEDYGEPITEHRDWDVFEKAIKNNMEIRMGSVSDEDGGIEAVLCDTALDYEDDSIIIRKEGGY